MVNMLKWGVREPEKRPMTANDSTNTTDKRPIAKLSVEEELDRFEKSIERLSEEEQEKLIEEKYKQMEGEARSNLANMGLPNEIIDRLVAADNFLQFIPAMWTGIAYKAGQDYEVERKHKLEIDRNSATAQAGLGFLGILTTLALNEHSTYLHLSVYTLCFVTPLLLARAYMLESALRHDEKPARALHSGRSLIFSALESIGLGVGILGLIAHYSEIAAALMAAGGVAAVMLTMVPAWSERDDVKEAQKTDSGK
jgi:hypothetical protein